MVHSIYIHTTAWREANVHKVNYRVNYNSILSSYVFVHETNLEIYVRWTS